MRFNNAIGWIIEWLVSIECLLKSILNPLEHLSILYKIRWSTHRILRAFQRRFTLNPKRFNINRHSNAFQKSSNLLHFGNIWKILKIRQNRSYNYHIITYLHRQNWQTMFLAYFYLFHYSDIEDWTRYCETQLLYNIKYSLIGKWRDSCHLL